ncbi:hypothetical protein [Flavobacterium sp.]|uniref:hypothetical protein n=1 Tax=Flavobacterium sp. TaxID=239 RepID=UPI00261C3623|nr:hypothetical protein [Flavobacterium sp.]MDD3005096.1 hypothetical protein [Flavobacterium sp.]
MKRIFLLLAVIGLTTLSSCEGDTGPQGPQGPPGIESEVFELQNVNFQLDQNNEYTIFQQLNPVIFDSDNILIYRMSGIINAQTPIWQLIPRTLYLNEGELDYDFDFSRVDFTIYAGGTYNLALTPQFINNQTFRIVIVPGYFSKDSNLDLNDYHAVIDYFNINDTNVKVLNKK